MLVCVVIELSGFVVFSCHVLADKQFGVLVSPKSRDKQTQLLIPKLILNKRRHLQFWTHDKKISGFILIEIMQFTIFSIYELKQNKTITLKWHNVGSLYTALYIVFLNKWPDAEVCKYASLNVKI